MLLACSETGEVWVRASGMSLFHRSSSLADLNLDVASKYPTITLAFILDHPNTIRYTAMHDDTLHCTALHCTALQCNAIQCRKAENTDPGSAECPTIYNQRITPTDYPNESTKFTYTGKGTQET